MTAKTLKIGVFVYPPYVNDCNVTVVYDSKFSCENPGIGIELTQEVCRWLNLRCNFYFVKDTVFGSKTENGSWTGMLGAIYAGKFDTSFPQYTPNPQRLADFAMTVPFINPEQSFLIRNPAEIEGNTNSDYMSILLPFNWLINVTFILAMLLVGSLLTWYELPPGISFCALLRKPKDFGSFWLTNMLDTVGMVIDKGRSGMMVKSATYILIGTWSLIAVVLVALYSAILLSALVATKFNLPFSNIKTFAECVAQKKCSWLTFTIQQSRYVAIQAATQGDYNELRLALEKNPPFIVPLNETTDVIMSTNNHYYVFWQSSFTAIQMVRYNCSYLIIPDGSTDRLSFPFAKQNLHFMKKFDMAQARFAEIGIIDRIIAKYIPHRVCETRGSSTGNPSITPFPLRSIIGPIFILLFGICGGLLAIAMEWSTIHCRKRETDETTETAGISQISASQRRKSKGLQSNRTTSTLISDEEVYSVMIY